MKIQLSTLVTVIATVGCASRSIPDEMTDGGIAIDGGGVVDAGTAPPSLCSRFATSVVAHQFGEGSDFGQAADVFPDNVLGPPEGGGCCNGGTDVVSLGNGGFVVVAFGGTTIVDGPGPDFAVFENPFSIGGEGGDIFAELGTVAVSDDGEAWREFPCTATEPPYGSCAGHAPVFAGHTPDVDPLDPESSGGDLFDLADIGVSSARYVRVTDREDLGDALDCCFDLDAVGVFNASCSSE